jgi:hypothetical protein
MTAKNHRGRTPMTATSLAFAMTEKRPISCVVRVIGSVAAMFGSTDQVEDLPMAAEQIREVLRARHRLQTEQDDDFTIRTQIDIGKVQEGTSETLTMMLSHCLCPF